MTDQIPLPFQFQKPSPRNKSTRGKGGSSPPSDQTPPPSDQAPPPPPGPSPIEPVALHEAARFRYLNYAMSVITARALPDVRDGLKPVQRRILYAMLHNLKLTPDARYRKSAAVVGEVMAKYHPHGDQSIYDAMVRMAQGFSLRSPLVDGNGNFGSLDGDPPAAMRYTEAKLRSLAITLLEELKQRTVHHRPNYDGTIFEPVVLPAQYPNLLVNGSTGIAVGMATNIPPHNLGEVVEAAIALSNEPDLTTPELCAFVKGPDFPMGGILCTPPEDLIRLYDRGEGPVKVRGEYKIDPEKKGTQLLITSIPYGVNKAQLVESIADHIVHQRIPQLLDVRDESTEDIRIVLELKRGASADLAMAYLYKHTALETTFHANMTALIPTENPEVCSPARLGLRAMLQHFLDFRMEIVTRRLEFELEQIKKRIHILEGFERIFDELDEAIRIIRASDGKADAATRLMARFFLDEIQADAILETKLYRLAKLEIESIREELARLRAEEDRLFKLLCDPELRWQMVRAELREIKANYGDPRRTKVDGKVEEIAFDPEAYIVSEETYVIVTRDGWIKRQKTFSDISSIRIREGDSVGWVYPVTTLEMMAFFTNLGSAYVLRVDEVPATTGYGEPVQRQFKFADQERVVGVVCFDPRCLPAPVTPAEDSPETAPEPDAEETIENGDEEGDTSGVLAVAITRQGKGLRLPLLAHSERSTKMGRRFIRLSDSPNDDGVVAVVPCAGDEYISLVTESARAILFSVSDLNVLRGSGKGVTAIKLQSKDRVLAYKLVRGKDEGLEVETNRGRRVTINARTYTPSRRGGKGTEIIKKGSVTLQPPDPVVVLRNEENES